MMLHAKMGNKSEVDCNNNNTTIDVEDSPAGSKLNFGVESILSRSFERSPSQHGSPSSTSESNAGVVSSGAGHSVTPLFSFYQAYYASFANGQWPQKWCHTFEDALNQVAFSKYDCGGSFYESTKHDPYGYKDPYGSVRHSYPSLISYLTDYSALSAANQTVAAAASSNNPTVSQYAGLCNRKVSSMTKSPTVTTATSSGVGGSGSANPATAPQPATASSTSEKKRRTWSRAVFSNLQRRGLEKRFTVQKYITKPDRRQLAATLGLTDAQVKVWFQNRRMKWRHSKQYEDELPHIRALHHHALQNLIHKSQLVMAQQPSPPASQSHFEKNTELKIQSVSSKQQLKTFNK